jgi:small acid-soluble spore protein I (minor)
MNITLRQAIYMRVEGKSNEEMLDVIKDSINGDEKALPGLGVLFEKMWERTDADLQKKLIVNLQEGLNQATVRQG